MLSHITHPDDCGPIDGLTHVRGCQAGRVYPRAQPGPASTGARTLEETGGQINIGRLAAICQGSHRHRIQPGSALRPNQRRIKTGDCDTAWPQSHCSFVSHKELFGHLPFSCIANVLYCVAEFLKEKILLSSPDLCCKCIHLLMFSSIQPKKELFFTLNLIVTLISCPLFLFKGHCYNSLALIYLTLSSLFHD